MSPLAKLDTRLPKRERGSCMQRYQPKHLNMETTTQLLEQSQPLQSIRLV